MAGKPPRTRIGTYSSKAALAQVDFRTKEGRTLRQSDEALIQQLGGIERCTAKDRMRIRAASSVYVRLEGLRARIASGEEMPESTDKNLSMLVSALRGALQDIGSDDTAQTVMTLEEYTQLKVVSG